MLELWCDVALRSTCTIGSVQSMSTVQKVASFTRSDSAGQLRSTRNFFQNCAPFWAIPFSAKKFDIITCSLPELDEQALSTLSTVDLLWFRLSTISTVDLVSFRLGRFPLMWHWNRIFTGSRKNASIDVFVAILSQTGWPALLCRLGTLHGVGPWVRYCLLCFLIPWRWWKLTRVVGHFFVAHHCVHAYKKARTKLHFKYEPL